MNRVWKILVPANFSLDHHRSWDQKVLDIAGGLTIMIAEKARGKWVDSDGSSDFEDMIPVFIVTSELKMQKICEMTMIHYNQRAVLAYEVSNKTILIWK